MNAKGFLELLELHAKLLSQPAWAAVTQHHRPGGFNHRRLFLAVPKAGRCKDRVPADSVLGEGPLSSLQKAAFLLCPQVMKTERSGVSFSSYQGTNPIVGVSPS